MGLSCGESRRCTNDTVALVHGRNGVAGLTFLTATGPIVRVNPYELHILDPDFYLELYASSRKLDKYRWWTNLAGADGSSFSTAPHDLHRLRRGALNPFFSVRSINRLEPLLKSKVEKLSARFDELVKTQEIVRLDAAFMALTMDIICDYAFARDRCYLDELDFQLLWKQTIIGAFEGGALGRQFPWMLPLMKRLPHSMVAAMNPAVGHLLQWQGLVREQVKPILSGTDEGRTKGRTIFHELLDSDLPPEEKTLQRFCDEGEILTGAGSETTAQALTRLFFYLQHVPKTLDLLRKELDKAIPSPSSIPSWAELQSLPYLVSPLVLRFLWSPQITQAGRRHPGSHSPLLRSYNPTSTNCTRGYQVQGLHHPSWNPRVTNTIFYPYPPGCLSRAAHLPAGTVA